MGRPVRRGTVAELEALSRSTHFDWRLTPYDLAGSRAHAHVLHRAGLLTDDDLAELLAASTRWGSGTPPGPAARPSDEDVHGALERLLLEEVGPEVGGRLRAGRSRNDQVATLFKAFLRDHARVIAELVLDLVDALATQAEEHRRPTRRRSCRGARTCSTPSRCCSRTTCWRTPGRCCATSSGSATGTPASPRDSPYGSGALAGTSLGLDPEAVARGAGLHRLQRQLHRRHRLARLRRRARLRDAR